MPVINTGNRYPNSVLYLGETEREGGKTQNYHHQISLMFLTVFYKSVYSVHFPITLSWDFQFIFPVYECFSFSSLDGSTDEKMPENLRADWPQPQQTALNSLPPAHPSFS